MYRTLVVLGLAQCFGQSASPMIVLLGGIVGAAIAPSADLATLPMALMIIGTACSTFPASMIMSRWSRKPGFLLATFYCALAGLVAAYAITVSSFVLFCLATFMVGSYIAFLQQFRFAVAESVPTEFVPKALSIIMLAGIVAAIAGPETAKRLSHVEGLDDYVGAFLGMSVLLVISFFILLFYREESRELETLDESPRPFLEIVRQPMLILAIAAAVVGWSIMSLIMTATPVAMHQMDHHSLADTTWVIQSHILAMYIPSLFSGVLVARFGAMKIIWAGLVVMLACIVAGYGNPALMHYWVSLLLLGIGWNFLFLGGTTLLTQTYRSSERFKIQALNDFSVFALQAVAALGSGVLLANIGWNGVILFSIPWLVLLIPVLVVVMMKQREPALRSA